MSAEGSRRAIVAALLANIGIAATKFLAFLLTQSASMLAESVHSAADSGNQLLLMLGARRSRRPADEHHPFGYGRARYFYAFLVAIVLFSVGGLFALNEARQKFTDPEPIEGWAWWVPLVVLVASIVMESFSLRTAVRESNDVRGTRTWRGFVRTTRSPELPVVLLEDTGALIGLMFALIGVTMTLITEDGRWDALGSGAIGLLLVVIAVVLAVETKSMLLGESASSENVAAIRAALVGEGVRSVIHLRTLHLGPDELLVAAKIEVPSAVTAADVAAAIDAAEVRIRAAVSLRTLIYLEPDLRATGSPDAEDAFEADDDAAEPDGTTPAP